jgi:hypothetical protein
MNTYRGREKTLGWRVLPAVSITFLTTVVPLVAQSNTAQFNATIRQGAFTPLSLNAPAFAACTLHPQADGDPAHALKLYADGKGVILLQARAAGASTAQMELECEANGASTVTQVVVNAENGARPGAGFSALEAAGDSAAKPQRLDARSRSGASFVRPALEGDPMLLSQEQLALRGYPARPDSKSAPEAYANWLKAVSRPATFIRPEIVARTDRAHGPANVNSGAGELSNTAVQNATSNNWSGYVAQGGGAVYTDVNGKWTVPAVKGELGTTTYSSLWVGLDGWGSSDVVQAGTEQQAVTFSFFGIQWSFGTYYAWYEYYPDYEKQISNFQVNPGDEVWAWVRHGYDYVQNRVDGSFWLENLTAGTYTFQTEAPPAGSNFLGNSAEWVMERPSLNGKLTDLSDYTLASMFGAYVWQSSTNKWVVFNQVPNFEVSMYNGSTLLSSASYIFPGTECMLFGWYAFH